MTDLHSIVSRLSAGTPLELWEIECRYIDNPDACARIQQDCEVRRALLEVSVDWESSSVCTLEQLVAHELGHAIIGDEFDALPNTRAVSKIEETLATRIGTILIANMECRSCR